MYKINISCKYLVFASFVTSQKEILELSRFLRNCQEALKLLHLSNVSTKEFKKDRATRSIECYTGHSIFPAEGDGEIFERETCSSSISVVTAHELSSRDRKWTTGDSKPSDVICASSLSLPLPAKRIPDFGVHEFESNLATAYQHRN